MSIEHLPAHQERVVLEKGELDDKIDKLIAFMVRNPIFADLPQAERDRLGRQFEAMRQYSAVLGERIAAFGA